MKKALFAALAFFLLGMYTHAGAQAAKTKPKKDSGKPAKEAAMVQAVSYPYTVTYSAQFEIGKPEQAQWLLGLYKGYENNDFSGDVPFADTVTAILNDGTVLKGRDQVSSAFQQDRANQQSIQFAIDAVIPVRSIDRNEDWVLVWGTANATAGGTSTKNEFHHIWRINKDGKIDFIQFYQGKTPESMQQQ